jgi:hypothetical protein
MFSPNEMRRAFRLRCNMHDVSHRIPRETNIARLVSDIPEMGSAQARNDRNQIADRISFNRR